MKLDISRVDVWSSPLQDKPGALAGKLNKLAEVGADLDFLLVRRTKRGQGVVYVAPIKGARQIHAAQREDFAKDSAMAVLRIEGLDRPGATAMISQSLAGAGVNISGVSTSSSGRKFISFVAFDGAADATRAQRALHKL